MTLLQTTESLCRKHGITPQRSKGQNFLIDEAAYAAMIQVAALRPEDIILEVGPGLGFLTERLARRVQKVYAVELDNGLASVLPKRLAEEGITNVTVFNEDILNFSGRFATELKAAGTFSVVANLPYNISSYFLRKFVSGNEGDILPDNLTLMLQKEVGERLAAHPGDMSILSVSVQFYARVILSTPVPAASFWPAPQVGSIIVRLERAGTYSEQLASLGFSEKEFFRLIKIGFSARRKMLKANLAAGFHIPQPRALELVAAAHIKPTARPQELSLKEWLSLIVACREFVV